MDPSNPRKAVGPKLKVMIRLRNPLLKSENVSKHERWFQIEFDKHPKTFNVDLIKSTNTN